MKKTILFFAIVLSFQLFSLNCEAQWQPTNGPYGGFVTCFDRVQNEIWVGTQLGIYTSQDEGQTWQKYSQFNRYIKDIKSFNDTIIIVYVEQVYDTVNSSYYIMCNAVTSYNKGFTWATPVTLLDIGCAGEEVKLYKVGKSIIMDVMGGYFISHDYAQNWELIPIPYGDFYDLLSTDGNKVVLRANFGSINNSHIFIADDDSLYWNQIDSTHTIYQTFIHGSVVLLTCVSYNPSFISYIVRSPDLGITWDTVYSSTIFMAGEYYYIDNKIYAYTGTIPLVSQDNGLTWNTTSFPLNYFYQGEIDLLSGDLLGWDGWTDDIMHYTISTNTSYNSSTGFTAHYITNLWSNHHNIFASTQQKSLFSTNDNGQSWSKNSFPYTAVCDMIFKGDTAFCVSSDWSRIGISFNNGFTWDTIPTPCISTIQTRASLALINDILYYSGDSIFFTSNCGLSWNLLPSLPTSNTCGSLSFDAGGLEAYKNELYSVTDDGYIFKFNTVSNNWTFLDCFPASGNDKNNFLYVLEDSIIAVSGSSSMLTSTDQGLNWSQPALNGIPNLNGKLYVPKDLISVNGKWYGSCVPFGVYMSYDHGNNWQKSFTGPNQIVAGGGLVENDSILFAGTQYNSVWKLPLSPDAGIYEIDQTNQLIIFPNPTSDKITIQTKTPTPQSYVLSVKNIQGQEVLSEKINFADSYSIDVSGLSNGVYILNLQNEKENFVKKIIIQK